MLNAHYFLGKNGVIKGLDRDKNFYREIQMLIPVLKFTPKGDVETNF